MLKSVIKCSCLKITLAILFCFLTTLSLKAQKNSTDYVTTWASNPLHSNPNLTIYTDTAYVYNYDVDWNNDGVFDTLGVQGDISHQYHTFDTVSVRIRGIFPRILSYNTNYFLVSIDQWGDTHLKNLSHAFSNTKLHYFNAKDQPNLDSVRNMSYMFENAKSFNGSIGNWDVSNVTDMRNMFAGAKKFNQPLDNWDVSKVADMRNMFAGAKKFNQSLDNWDVNKVTDMSYMFFETDSFNGAIGNWNVSNVTKMQRMFFRAPSFNQPIGNWDVSYVTDMSLMFKNATSFNQPIGNWNVRKVIDMNQMLSGAFSFNQPIGNWDVSNVTNMYSMFFMDSVFNQPLQNWNVSKVTNMGGMFAFSAFNQPIGNWKLDSITVIWAMFYNATSFNQNLSNWNIKKVTNFRNMFDNTAISVANYDSILIAWQARPHKRNVPFGALGLHYCLGDSARQLLIKDGWTFNGDTLDCNFVGIENNKITETELSLFPNPTKGIVNLKLTNQTNNFSFQLYNAKGQLIKNLWLTEGENKIDLSGQANGLYFITNGELGKKLVVER